MKRWFITFKTRREVCSIKEGIKKSDWEFQHAIIDIHPILFCKKYKDDESQYYKDFNQIIKKNSKRRKKTIYYDQLIMLFYNEVPNYIDIPTNYFE